MTHQWEGMNPESSTLYEKTSTNVSYERNWTVESKDILHFSYVELYLCYDLFTEENVKLQNCSQVRMK